MEVNSWLVKNYLDKYLPIFYAKYPKVKIQLFDGNGLQMLKDKQVDFVIDYSAVLKSPDIKIKPLLKEVFLDSFVATKDFLAKHKLGNEITKNDLLKLPIIARAEIWQFYQEQFGESVCNVINVPSVIDVYSMMKKSIGIGVFGHTQYKELNDPSIVELKVKDLTLMTATVVCGYNSLSRPAQAFIDGLIKLFQENNS